ncbi:MAG TPA: TetR/AcrR family transcriptional regulator [Ktedonobacteraceae bacterium]|jgi:AcrR family transcriptional regulator|nr:TetR/AcrR family transcriptional regulator [Ktedonobacteraceae bacterium]
MPRLSAENQRIRDERQEHLLRAAAHVFARKGLTATTIADIAAVAHVSHGLAYHYFASKEEIFRQLVTRAMQGTERLLRGAQAREGTVIERLRWLINEMIEGARDSSDDMLIVQQAAINEAVPPDVRELVLQRSPMLLALMCELLREGQRNGEIIAGDPGQLATLLLSCIQGIFSNKTLHLDQYQLEPETMLHLFQVR